MTDNNPFVVRIFIMNSFFGTNNLADRKVIFLRSLDYFV